jgi:type II secretory ATPase GspE/PulE/Tfp pilus assembly ATPase PilB-like protein
VFEVLAVTPAVRELIDQSASVAAIRKQVVGEGMIEFRHAAVLKVAQGQTSIEEVVRVLPTEYLAPGSP